MNYPSSTWLVYGDPGSGKSHFAATFPKPMLVLCTDPRGKAMPYLKRGKLSSPIHNEYDVWCQSVMSKKNDNMLITVEYYQDDNIKGGSDTIYAYEKLEERLLSLPGEIEEGAWATVVLDSLSFLEYQVRKLHQYKLNPESNQGNQQDARQWYNSSAEAIEEFCYSRLTWLPVNVMVLAHIRDTKSKIRDVTTWTPEAPGVKGRKLPGAFAEVYVIHSTEEGRYLQTVNDQSFIATTQIGAPNGCTPNYKALWSQWDEWQKQ
jgi:hypothetical protein